MESEIPHQTREQFFNRYADLLADIGISDPVNNLLLYIFHTKIPVFSYKDSLSLNLGG